MVRVRQNMLGASACAWLAFLPIVVVLPSKTLLGAPFQNLDFEKSTVRLDPDNPVYDASTSAAFPNWVVAEGGSTIDSVNVNGEPLDETSITLVTDAVSYPYSGESLGEEPPQGESAIQLYACALGDQGLPGEPTTASISQTGDVPVGTNTIQFVVAKAPVAGPFLEAPPLLFVNGSDVAIYPIAPYGSAELWAGDVSSYAGTTATVEFEAAGVLGTFPGNEDVFILDAISFSPDSLPEPGAASAIIVCTASMMRRKGRPQSGCQPSPSRCRRAGTPV